MIREGLRPDFAGAVNADKLALIALLHEQLADQLERRIPPDDDEDDDEDQGDRAPLRGDRLTMGIRGPQPLPPWLTRERRDDTAWAAPDRRPWNHPCPRCGADALILCGRPRAPMGYLVFRQPCAERFD